MEVDADMEIEIEIRDAWEAIRDTSYTYINIKITIEIGV